MMIMMIMMVMMLLIAPASLSSNQEDRALMSQGKPATQKLKKLKDVMDLLKNRHLQGALVDNGQLLGLIRQWLQPLPGEC